MEGKFPMLLAIIYVATLLLGLVYLQKQNEAQWAWYLQTWNLPKGDNVVWIGETGCHSGKIVSTFQRHNTSKSISEIGEALHVFKPRWHMVVSENNDTYTFETLLGSIFTISNSSALNLFHINVCIGKII
jgi:hypothetical protein